MSKKIRTKSHDFNIADMPDGEPSLSIKDIEAHCKTYIGADTKRSIFQLISTLALFIGTCVLMVYSTNISYWITVLLTLPAAGLLVRLFIFQHD